jgi:hypothetical protein
VEIYIFSPYMRAWRGHGKLLLLCLLRYDILQYDRYRCFSVTSVSIFKIALLLFQANNCIVTTVNSSTIPVLKDDHCGEIREVILRLHK